MYPRLTWQFVKTLLCWRSKYSAQKPIEKSEPRKNSEKHERMLEGEYFSTVHSLMCMFSSIAGSWIVFALTNQHSFLWTGRDLLLIVGPCNAASWLFLFSSPPSSPIRMWVYLVNFIWKYFLFSCFLTFLLLSLPSAGLLFTAYVWIAYMVLRRVQGAFL